MKWPNSALSVEHEQQWLLFLNFYFKFIAVSKVQFRDSFDSYKQNK